MSPNETRVTPDTEEFQLLVSGGWHSVQLRLDYLLHFPNPDQVGHSIALFLPVENLLTIEVYFEPAIRAGGERNCSISTKCTEELVRHPRGGRAMFSSDTVQDINQNFPLRCGHYYPPLCKLSSHTCNTQRPLALSLFYAFLERSQAVIRLWTCCTALGKQRGPAKTRVAWTLWRVEV